MGMSRRVFLKAQYIHKLELQVFQSLGSYPLEMYQNFGD